MENDKNQNEEPFCKICHNSEDSAGNLVHPCLCKGTMKHIHEKCLFEWLKNSKGKRCDICKYEFKFKKVFKEDMPQKLPPSLIASYIYWHLKKGFFKLFCLFYFISRHVAILAINCAIFEKTLVKIPSNRLVWISYFLLAIFSTLVNFFHIYFYKMVKFALRNTRAIHINPRRTLVSMASDQISRTESSESDIETLRTFLTTQSSFNEELNDDSIEDDSEDMSDENNMSNIPVLEFSLFQPITLGSIKKDLMRISTFTGFSLSVPFLSLYKIIVPLTKQMFLFLQLFPSVSCFLNDKAIKTFLININSFILFSILTCTSFYSIMVYGKNKAIRLPYYYLRTYIVTVLSTLYSFVIIGTFFHYGVFTWFNSRKHLISISNPSYSLFAHTLVGLLIAKIVQSIKEKYVTIFRPGLINMFFKKKSITPLLKYSLETNISALLLNYTKNLSLILGLVMVTLCSQSFDYTFKIDSRSINGLLIVFKESAVVLSSVESLVGILCSIYKFITKALAYVFNLENYFFNKKIDKYNQSKLIWDLNVHFYGESKKRQVDAINRAVKELSSSKESTIKRESCDSSSDNESDRFSMGSLSTFSRASRIRIRTNSSSLRSSSYKSSSRASLSYVSEKNERIYSKYKITESNIEKYFGNVHKKKYSLFYKPTFYSFYKLIIFLSCLAATQIFFSSVIYITNFILRRFPIASKNFIFVFIAVIRGIRFLSQLQNRNIIESLSYLLKHSIVHGYTNIIWPITSSFIYMLLLCDCNSFVRFSKLFMLSNSLSPLTLYFLRILAFGLPIEQNSVRYIVKSVISFAFLKISMVSFYIVYSHYVGVMTLITILVSGLCLAVIGSMVKYVLSGQLFDKVRDTFFLKERSIVNYEEGS